MAITVGEPHGFIGRPLKPNVCICGMYKTRRVHRKPQDMTGKTYYFCVTFSAQCTSEFDANEIVSELSRSLVSQSVANVTMSHSDESLTDAMVFEHGKES